jgi:hypothetical protein
MPCTFSSYRHEDTHQNPQYISVHHYIVLSQTNMWSTTSGSRWFWYEPMHKPTYTDFRQKELMGACYSSATCSGISLASSYLGYVECDTFCQTYAAPYLTHDSNITTADNCFCFASEQCSSPLYLPNQPTTTLFRSTTNVSPCWAVLVIPSQ